MRQDNNPRVRPVGQRFVDKCRDNQALAAGSRDDDKRVAVVLGKPRVQVVNGLTLVWAKLKGHVAHRNSDKSLHIRHTRMKRDDAKNGRTQHRHLRSMTTDFAISAICARICACFVRCANLCSETERPSAFARRRQALGDRENPSLDNAPDIILNVPPRLTVLRITSSSIVLQ